MFGAQADKFNQTRKNLEYWLENTRLYDDINANEGTEAQQIDYMKSQVQNYIMCVPGAGDGAYFIKDNGINYQEIAAKALIECNPSKIRKNAAIFGVVIGFSTAGVMCFLACTVLSSTALPLLIAGTVVAAIGAGIISGIAYNKISTKLKINALTDALITLENLNEKPSYVGHII